MTLQAGMLPHLRLYNVGSSTFIKMEYYLTHMIYKVENVTGQFTITQLVKASNKDEAREAVRKAAEKEFIKGEHILQIRVDDTLVGS
jgi:hypothetical protein